MGPAQIRLTAGKVHQLRVKDISPDPSQPRREFEATALKELADNIKARGVLQPLTVRKVDGEIIIKMGERRWRAAKLAGVKEVPCILDDSDQDDVDRGLDQVAENELRANLNPMDMADFLVRLRTEQHKSVDELCSALEKAGMKHVSRPLISNLMRLVELPDWAKDMIRAGTLTAAHGKYLLQARDLPDVMKRVKQGLERDTQWKGSVTVKELEELVHDELDQAGIDLNAQWGERVRLFKITECRKCEFYRKAGNTEYCFNEKEFDRKQAEAKALIKENPDDPRLTKAAKELAGEERKAASPREDARREAENTRMQLKSVQTRVENFVEAWLRNHLITTVLPAQDRAYLDRIVFFLALGMPHTPSYSENGYIANHVEHNNQEEARKAMKRTKLSAFITGDGISKSDAVATAQACVKTMTRSMIHEVCSERGVQLDPAFRVSEEYLAILRRPQLEALAKVAKLPTIAGTTGKQIKAELLKPESVAAIGVPAAVAKAYKPPVSQETTTRKAA